MPATAILYLGNPIVDNDRIGVLIGQRLARDPEVADAANVREFVGSPLDLMTELGRYARVVFVDAVFDPQSEPGTVVRLEGARLEARGRTWSPHGVNFPEALALARRWGLPVPSDLLLLGIVIPESHRFGNGLDPRLAARAEELYAEIRRLILEAVGRSPAGPRGPPPA